MEGMALAGVGSKDRAAEISDSATPAITLLCRGN